MGEYNPDQPYVQGMQWAPLLADSVLLDTGTELGYTFRAMGNPRGDADISEVQILMTSPPPGDAIGKELLVNMYPADQVAATGPIRKLTIPCVSGTMHNGATLGGSADSVAYAVHNPADRAHVALPGPNAFCRFWFDTASPQVTAALEGRRILDVTVLYAVTGPFGTAGAMTLGLERPSPLLDTNWVMDDTVSGPPVHGAAVVLRRARLGELNPWWDAFGSPQSHVARMPWTLTGPPIPRGATTGLTDLSAATPNINVRLSTGAVPGDAVFQVHYLALEITYCEENRIGGGGLDITGGGAVYENGLAVYQVPVTGVLGMYGRAVRLRRKQRYALTVGQAFAGQVSVASPVPVRIDRLGAMGEFPHHRGLVLRKTLRVGEVPTVQMVDEMPAMLALFGTSFPTTPDRGSHPYLAQAVGTLCNRYGPDATTQTILDEHPGTFVWARFYARHLPGTRNPLQVLQLNPDNPSQPIGPRAEIDVDAFDALPELTGGWREVTVRLNPPARMHGGGQRSLWGFYSAASADTPWQVLGADSNPGSLIWVPPDPASYGGEAVAARIDGQDDLSADLTLMLAREMDPVLGLSLNRGVQPLTVVDPDCPRPPGGIATGVYFHRLWWDEIDSDVLGGWGCYELQRQDDTMGADEWETIAKVIEPTVTSIDDFEARVGVTSRYRIRMVHRTRIAGPWSEPVSSTIPPPGVTGVAGTAGVLILTSNHHPDAALAYVMTWDRGVTEDFAFPEAAQVELRSAFGRDYRTAFRSLERGGVEFTRTLLVNAAAVPTATMAAGFTGLRDLAWDTVPYVCVRDELQNRWLSALLVPSGSVRRRAQGHLHVAQVTVVEVTDTPAPIDGGRAPCEGLRLEGTVDTVTAQADTPPTVSPLVMEDNFIRVAIDGWGNDTGTPGMSWRRIEGLATDLAVRSTSLGYAGSITLAQHGNTNPSMEQGVAGWTATGGVLTRSTAQARRGAASLLLTPTGTAALVRAESDAGAGVRRGVLWRASAWVRCPVARSVVIGVTFYDEAGAAVGSSTSAPIAVAANTWTLVSRTAETGSAEATRAAVTVGMDGTPPATHLLFIEDATIGPAPTAKALLAGPSLADVDVRAQVALDTVAEGQPISAYLIGRDAGDGTHHRAQLLFNPNGTLSLVTERVEGGVVAATSGAQPVTDATGAAVRYEAQSRIWLRLQVRGPVIQAAAWRDGATFAGWAARMVDTVHVTAGQIGFRAAAQPGNTNLSATMFVLDVAVRRPLAVIDVRAQLRPTADQWSVTVGHHTRTGPSTITPGWSVEFDDRQGCFQAFGAGVFDMCTDLEGRAIALRQRGWLRAVYSLNARTGDAQVDMYYSLSPSGEWWTRLLSGTADAEPLDVDPGFLSVSIAGGVTVSRVEIRDGYDGPLLAAPRFAGQPPGTTSFTDEQGNTWAVSGRGICPEL